MSEENMFPHTRFSGMGGLLISLMIGIDNRTTMDMDTTVKGIPLQEDKIKEILEDIRIDSYLNDLWQVYLKDNPYAEQLKFLDIVEVVMIIADKVRN